MSKEYFIGVDVSKDKLDICFITSNELSKPKFETLPNNKEVIRSYFKSYYTTSYYSCFTNYLILRS